MFAGGNMIFDDTHYEKCMRKKILSLKILWEMYENSLKLKKSMKTNWISTPCKKIQFLKGFPSNPIFDFWLLASGFWLPIPGFRFPASRFCLSGFWLSVFGFRHSCFWLASGFWIRGASSIDPLISMRNVWESYENCMRNMRDEGPAPYSIRLFV